MVANEYWSWSIVAWRVERESVGCGLRSVHGVSADSSGEAGRLEDSDSDYEQDYDYDFKV